MDIQIYFSEKPVPMEWGKRMNVPVNISKDDSVDENGKKVKGWRADIVPNVELPLNADNIIAAAINDRYDQDTQLRILRNMGKVGNTEVNEYQSFIEYITDVVKKAGYK